MSYPSLPQATNDPLRFTAFHSDIRTDLCLFILSNAHSQLDPLPPPPSSFLHANLIPDLSFPP